MNMGHMTGVPEGRVRGFAMDPIGKKDPGESKQSQLRKAALRTERMLDFPGGSTEKRYWLCSQL